MNKIELLAPAGDFESLVAAIQNGANAIYLGGQAFSARYYATNFSLEEIKQAIIYAHLRDVKVYVTINTLIKDEEFNEILEFIDKIVSYHVDAILVQDLGLIYVLRHLYPELELHASTQMTIHSLSSIKYLEELGIKRVVLARENSIDDIKYILQHSNIEIEVFAHGALCVSYSGQCLMSSMIGKRSGNRGACAQPCRLEYSLYEGDKLLSTDRHLSLKDLCTINNVDELIEAGVSSLKLEGRMKKPEYVAAITKAYRHQIDSYYKHRYRDNTQDLLDMKSMFNRDYTKGYLLNDKSLAAHHISGHQGMKVGKVLSYQNHKARILCDEKIHIKDQLLFNNKDKFTIHSIKYIDDHIVEIEVPYHIQGDVYRLINQELLEELQDTYKENHIYHHIDMTVYVYKNELLKIEAYNLDIYVSYTSSYTVQESLSQPMSYDNIKKLILKTGESVYHIDSINIVGDKDIFIPVKFIKELRREVFHKLDDYYLDRKDIDKKELPDLQTYNHASSRYIVVVRDSKQLDIVSQYDCDCFIYYDKSLNLRSKSDYKNIGLFIPPIMYDSEIKYLIDFIDKYHIDNFIVNDLGTYALLKDKNVIIGPHLHIYNKYSASYYKEPVILSYECTYKQMTSLLPYNKEVIVPIYGRIENMITKHCMISEHYFHKQHKQCQKCKNHQYKLVDKKGYHFPVLTDSSCHNHILNSVPLFINDHIKDVSYLITLTIEDSIEDICEYYFNKKDIDIKEYTKGYLKKL